MKNKFEKYSAYPPVKILDRKWPNNIISKAPVWCSVDLRDGNQSLIERNILLLQQNGTSERLELANKKLKEEN